MHSFPQPKDIIFPPELSIETFFILKVSSLHAVPNPMPPCTGWSAAPPFTFYNILINKTQS
jgi:hypothetical protein